MNKWQLRFSLSGDLEGDEGGSLECAANALFLFMAKGGIHTSMNPTPWCVPVSMSIMWKGCDIPWPFWSNPYPMQRPWPVISLFFVHCPKPAYVLQ
ncbi:hypothetical protein AVP43_02782 [Geobacillus stearothermophilus]|nr:hypothetical protein AVP43_02782 [Geobacillus stearothermophilus]